jgi:hypothetical protein
VASVWSKNILKIQRGNKNPHIEEEQTTQWQKESVHKGKQRSTKHTYKTRDRVTRTPQESSGVTLLTAMEYLCHQ